MTSAEAKANLEREVLAAGLRENKAVLKGVLAIVEVSKQLRVMTKEAEIKRADIQRLDQGIRDKELQKASSVMEVAVMINDLRTQAEGQDRIPMDRVFIDEGDLVQGFRDTLADLSLKLRYLYCYDTYDQPTMPFINLTNRYANNNH